jgi:glycosyltransferase involved in cell wall biosynthesis
MNILFHHRTRGKGAEGVHIRGVVKGLTELGHAVDILSLPGSEPEKEEALTNVPDAASSNPASPGTSSTIPSQEPKKKSLLSSVTELTRYVPEFAFELLEILFNLVSYWRIRRSVKHYNTHLIYERYSLFLFSTVWWAKRKGIPIVLEINDSCLVHRVRPLFFKQWARMFEKWIFQNADGLVFISSKFKQVSEAAYGEIAPSVVSPNAADIERFSPDSNVRDIMRAKLGLGDSTVVGYVGAFVHWHGIDWFVEEIVNKLKDHPDLVLLLVGDGVCFAQISELVEQAGMQQQIILPGRVPHEQIPCYIEAMDYGILPDSNDYGSPMKLFEFMAMCKGMVAPDFSPISEVVKDGETSWLFPANDRQACVQKTLDLAKNQQELLRVGQQARSYIERERQWKHNAEALLTLIDK